MASGTAVPDAAKTPDKVTHNMPRPWQPEQASATALTLPLPGIDDAPRAVSVKLLFFYRERQYCVLQAALSKCSMLIA